MKANNQLKKKAVLITLADKKYLEYAKQVFAGAYFNAGWQGDYMLFAHDTSEKDVRWFRKKGILVKHCKPIYNKPIADTPSSYISRLYLFTPEFKKWSIIVYIDVDVIIRGSLDNLLNVKTFAAVPNVGGARLEDELIYEGQIKTRDLTMTKFSQSIQEFKGHYSVWQSTFCAGFFVLNTSLIKKKTFSDIKNIIDRYQKIAANADQFALNLHFYQKWQRLPAIYDFYISDGRNQWGLPNKKIRSLVIHFLGESKPWMTKNYFYQEWLKNLTRAEEINLKTIPSVQALSEKEIGKMTKNLAWREKIFYFHFRKYLLKQFLNKNYFMIVNFFERTTPCFFKFLKTNKKKLKILYEKTSFSHPRR